MLDENQTGERLRQLLHDPRWSVAPRPGAEARIRGAARRQRLRTAGAATAVIAVLTAAIVVPLTLLPGGGAASSAGTGPAAGAHHRPGRAGQATIMINPQGGETFGPAPASATPKLTAQQAWARYMHHPADSRAGIPSGVHARLGLFTLQVGPAKLPVPNDLPKAGGKAYSALDELAYGYSSPSACVTINPRLVAPPDAHCVFWTFLNANTGQQIDSTFQQIGHWRWLINPKAP